MRTIEARQKTESKFKAKRGIYFPGGFTTNWGLVNSRFETDRPFAYDPKLRRAKLEEKDARSKNLFTLEKVTQVVERADSEDLAGIFLEGIENNIAIRTPTNPAKEISLYKTSVLVPVTWNYPCEVKGVPVNGKYVPKVVGGDIYITAPEPTAKERLLSLATTGKLPQADDTYFHEKTHALQFDVANGRPIPRELLEVQAFRSTQNLMKEIPPEHLVKHISTAKVYDELEPDKVASAVWDIDRMQALLIPEVTIADIISEPGAWNEHYGLWTNVHEAIDAEKEEFGMNDTDLERAVMLGDLEKSTDILIARNTAQIYLAGVYQEDDFRYTQARHSATP